MHQEKIPHETSCAGSTWLPLEADLNSVGIATLLLVGAHHLAQLILFGEFAGENSQISDKLMAGSDDSILGGDFAVGLDAKDELGNQRVRNLACTC